MQNDRDDFQNASKKETTSCNLNTVYSDISHHICCLIPIYIDGGDYTDCNIEPIPDSHTTYIIIGDFDPILVFHSPDYVQRKLRDALLEHIDYIKGILAKMIACGKPYVVMEIYVAVRALSGL